MNFKASIEFAEYLVVKMEQLNLLSRVWEPVCFHSARKTQITDEIFKMTLIHAKLISQISYIYWIH